MTPGCGWIPTHRLLLNRMGPPQQALLRIHQRFQQVRGCCHARPQATAGQSTPPPQRRRTLHSKRRLAVYRTVAAASPSFILLSFEKIFLICTCAHCEVRPVPLRHELERNAWLTFKPEKSNRSARRTIYIQFTRNSQDWNVSRLG